MTHQYRRDIDGLRGIAVLGVLAFHAGLSSFSGGYVGVDVFFVISGFLITGIILADIDRSRLSIIDFYERRIRRIFPALFAMLLCSLVVVSWVFVPNDYVDAGRTAISTALFSSNIQFWLESGYFSPAAESRIFLHTWSLALEEQFYFVHPLLLFLLARYLKNGIVKALIVLTVLLFLFSIPATAVMPVAAFYLLPCRAWELLLGAVLATGKVPGISSARYRNLMGVAGLGLIAIAIGTFTKETAFPGLAALVPCLGAAFVIHSGRENTWVGRALGFRPLVFVGLISYSLYLWHWPVLVILKHMLVTVTLSAPMTLLAVLISFALAVLSWRFVELPFRDRRKWSRQQIFAAGSAMMATTLVLAGVTVATGGLPGRFDDRFRTVLAASNNFDWRSRECLGIFSLSEADAKGCRVGRTDTPATFLLWGDSHGGALLPAIDQQATRHGKSGYLLGQAGCPPLTGVSMPGHDRDCLAASDAIMKIIRSNPAIDTIILDARWALYSEGHRYKDEQGGGIFSITDDGSRRMDVAENRPTFVRTLGNTLDALVKMRKRVVLIGPVPEIGRDVPMAMAMRLRTGIDPDIAPTSGDFLERQAFVMQSLQELASRYGTKLLSPHETLCEGGRCLVEQSGRVFYTDTNHLSRDGAVYIAPVFDRIFLDSEAKSD